MLYADSPVDTSLLSLYVHQNYTQFCDDVDHCDALIANLSAVDTIGEGESVRAPLSYISSSLSLT